MFFIRSNIHHIQLKDSKIKQKLEELKGLQTD